MIFSLFLCSGSSHRWCSVKKVFQEILQNSQENTCVEVSFLIKFGLNKVWPVSLTLTQMFSYELCKISKKPFLKVLHGTICMIRFGLLLFGFKIFSYKSEEIELILSFKNRIIQILMQKVVTIFQFTCSD